MMTKHMELTPRGDHVLCLNLHLANYLSPVNEMIGKYSYYLEMPFSQTSINENNKITGTKI
jgi:hypothetical protein